MKTPGFLIALSLVCGACVVQSENIGQHSSELVPSANHRAVNVVGERETSAVAIPNGQQVNYLIGFNDDMAGPNLTNGWTVTDSASLGAWTTHRQTCGTPCTFGGWFSPPSSELSISGSTFTGYQGDPTVVWTGNRNQAAYVSVVNTSASSASDVVIAVSNDGGTSFSNPHIVNGPSNGQHIDQPSAVLDTDSPTHDIYVWWRQTSTSNSFIQKLSYDTAGNLNIDRSRVVSIPASALAFYPFNATVGVGHVGSSTYVFLVYTSAIGGSCPGTGTTPVEQMNLAISWTGNLGASWQNQVIKRDSAWPDCISDNTVQGSSLVDARPYFAFDKKEHTCWVSFMNSGPNGARVHVYNNVTGAWGSVPTWEPQSGFHDQWDQEMAYTAPCSTCIGTIAVTWKDSRLDPGGANRYVVIEGATSTNDGHTWTGATPVSDSTTPWDNNLQLSADYDGMAANPVSGRFLAVWGGDTRNNPTGAGCNFTGGFFNGCSEIWASEIIP